ncbi:MAG: alpha-1,3-galactosidase B [Bacteroidales bacterium]|nr:alpha-1,3-galactosidase B [Bacteroidales bacterium]
MTSQNVRTYDITTFMEGENAAEAAARAISQIKQEAGTEDSVVLTFPKGVYHFYPEGAQKREYYISNHDQVQPKAVGIDLVGLKRFTLDGQGSDFIFHGRMLPVALVESRSCTLQGFSIDFDRPHISQVRIVEQTPEGTVFDIEPWVDYRVTADSLLEVSGEGWRMYPQWGIAFEGDTRHLVYQTSDVWCPMKGVQEIGPRRLIAPQWRNERLVEGTVVALRGWGRPAPGIFLADDVNTRLLDVTVHYAEGMGLLAQLCDNVTLEGFRVALRGNDDPRYFTAQADATHFSGCKGTIRSVGGLYEGMMDDAINVHGTYLKVVGRPDDFTLIGQYMHDQSWGFGWGEEGDSVEFVRSSTMEIVGSPNVIASIAPEGQDSIPGVKAWRITFRDTIPAEVNPERGYGIENLTWTPSVYFADNVIRNNRARGSLFSTPRPTLVERNLFDHTSGTAILLCGDCNGWYETGACRDVVIRHNRFVNALTNMFQFTNAVISIYPEIPNLEGQQQYFHSGIVIEENTFETFDAPILYAKSVADLIFRRNTILTNHDYPPFHPCQSRFWLERVGQALIE